MADFIAFVPAKAKRAENNRVDFIEFARTRIKTFGASLPFDASRWDVTEDFRRRGTVSGDYLIFHKLGHDRGHEAEPMGEPLASFAKAYIRYASSQNQRKSPPHREVRMFRLIDAALCGLGHKPDVGLLDTATCNRAIAIGRQHYSDQTTVLIGACMERLVRFLRKQRMTDRLHVRWKHGIKINRKRGRASAEADEARMNKLPSKAALEAIPKAYLLATEPRHVIATSVLALHLSAPERINETVGLSSSCEIDELIDGKPVYGLRWAGSKGHSDHVKYIPKIMVDLAKGAIERLRLCSADARAVARWYEENPSKLWLSPENAYLRGCDLTLEDICRIVGFRGLSGALAFCKRMGVQRHGCRPGKTRKEVNVYRFNDVEKAIVSKLPANFPIADPRSGLKYQDALLVCHYNTFGDDTPWRCMIEPVKLTSIYHQIRKNPDGRANMFDRLGLATAENPISLTSHQLRHYLNTIALSAGLSDIDVSAWSGRLNRRQNDAYDHETSESILETARAVANARNGEQFAFGDIEHRVPHSDAEPTTWNAMMYARAHGHATEYGFCEHDFAAAPCSMFMACLNCIKHSCIKGADPGQFVRLERSLAMALLSLERAREARLADYEGGAEWVEAHEQTVERLRQLVGFLSDPDVPSGAVIRLARSGHYNIVEQALHDRNSPTHLGRALPPGHEPARMIGPSL